MGWDERAISDFIVAMQQGDADAMQWFYNNAGPLRDAILPGIASMGADLPNRLPFMLDAGEGMFRGMPELFQNAGGLYMTPEMQSYIDRMGGVGDSMGGFRDIAGQGFAGGGWTPQYQQGFDWMSPFMQGRGSNAQMAMGDLGPELLGQRGKTNLTMGFQDRALDGVNSGGWNPWLSTAMDMAVGGPGGLTSGGYTPQMQALTGRGFDILQGGGDTPRTLAMQDFGLDAAAQNPLMSPEQMANFAREDATQQIGQQAEAMWRKANQRSGGPGAVTGAGSSNSMLADFADDAARLQAENVRKALLGRQELGLQEKGMGADLFAAGMNPSLQRMGIGADLALGAEGAAADRMSTAFGAIPGTQSAATNALDAFSRMGLGAGGLETQRMGLGGDLSNMFTQGQLGFGGLFGDMTGRQNQYALGLGGLYNDMSGMQGGLYNDAFGGMLGSGNLGVNRATNLAGAMNTSFGNWTGAFGQGSNTWNNAMNQLNTLAGYGNSRGNQFLSNWATPYGGMYDSGGNWWNLAGQGLAAAGNAAGAIRGGG